MHELSIAMSMIDMAAEEAARRGDVRVNAIHLRLGPLSGVVKDALLFSYEVACQGTSLEGSQLLIDEIPITGNCGTCLEETAVISPQQMCCARCDTPMTDVVHGRELEVSALEIEGEIEG
jgi:hydrogenase nickel incorporation protein HypA/HybF